MTSEERISAALAALDRATLGPWHSLIQSLILGQGGGFFSICGNQLDAYGREVEVCEINDVANGSYDADLIAAAPDLAREVVRLREWQKKAVPYLEGITFTQSKVLYPEVYRLLGEAEED